MQTISELIFCLDMLTRGLVYTPYEQITLPNGKKKSVLAKGKIFDRHNNVRKDLSKSGYSKASAKARGCSKNAGTNLSITVLVWVKLDQILL